MDGAAKSTLSLDDIHSQKREDAARACHEIYRRIHFGHVSSKPSVGAAWNELKLYQQDANRLQFFHAPTREYMLRTASTQAASDELRRRLAAIGITAENTSFVYKGGNYF